MTDEQILTKAIQKAIDGGYSPEPLFAWIPEDREALLEFWLNKNHPHYSTVIFNHDFAKALWGETSDTMTVQNNSINVKQIIDMNGWRYHLQQMVVADDPIKYLGYNL